MFEDQITAFVHSLLRAMAPWYGIMVAVAILGVIWRVIILPKLKGWAGEAALHAYLRRKLHSSEYRLLRNIMLPDANGTTQIDHIVISQYGVFVIETKTYKGWIYGSERDAQWTQVVYRQKNRFQNPLRQNYKHTKTLSDLIGIPHDDIKSVVAFSGDCKFKTDMPENVMKFRDVPGYIRAFRVPVFSREQVAEIAAAINEWESTVNKRQRSNHVRNLKRAHSLPEIDNGTPSCPRCGGRMVSRTNRSNGNAFWGCSKYPACRGIRQISR